MRFAFKPKLETLSLPSILVGLGLVCCCFVGISALPAFFPPFVGKCAVTLTDSGVVLEPTSAFGLNLVYTNTTEVSVSLASSNEERTIEVSAVYQCSEEECSQMLLFVPFNEFPQYTVQGFVDGLGEFEFLVYNPEFTTYLLAFKTVLFVLSIASLGWYLHRLRQLPSNKWKFEQKLVLVLSGSLVLFNDPASWLLAYFPSLWTVAASGLCTTQFLAIVLASWMILFTRHNPITSKLLFYIGEVALVTATYILVCLAVGWALVQYVRDPTFNLSQAVSAHYMAEATGLGVLAANVLLAVTVYQCI